MRLDTLARSRAHGSKNLLGVRVTTLFCDVPVTCPCTLASVRAREPIQKAHSHTSSRERSRSVISPTGSGRAATAAASSDLRIQEQFVWMLFLHTRDPCHGY